jgi:hypothetical protein
MADLQHVRGQFLKSTSASSSSKSPEPPAAGQSSQVANAEASGFLPWRDVPIGAHRGRVRSTSVVLPRPASEPVRDDAANEPAGRPRRSSFSGSGSNVKPLPRRIAAYDVWAAKNDGEKVSELLEQGASHLASKDGGRKSQAKIGTWRDQQLSTLAVLMENLTTAELNGNPARRTAVAMMMGPLKRGGNLRLPPDAAKLADTVPLFRGTTIDSKTNEPYVGSAGSRGKTPTTPGAIQALLFAMKGAHENRTTGATGTVVWGPISNVRQTGFAQPDVMAGQEQELTVNASPQDTNKLLGNRSTVPHFRNALKLLGFRTPEHIEVGEEFDRHVREAKDLTPEQLTDLQKHLKRPPEELAKELEEKEQESLAAKAKAVAATKPPKPPSAPSSEDPGDDFKLFDD